MEFTILSSIPLGVWVVGLPRPSDRIAHILHDSHSFDGLNVEVALGDAGAVSL